MPADAVRVLLLATWPRDNSLEFVLIFPDGYEKHYNFDEYGIRSFRGANERSIIEQCAAEYFADNGQPADIISLIFL